MNLADSSRKGQVHLYLLLRKGQWVDGPELANEAVGGSEGLKRLRELRIEGEESGEFRIEAHKHPDPGRDIWQYRLVDGPPPKRRTPQPVSGPPPYTQDPPVAQYAAPADRGLPRISDYIHKTSDGGFEIIKALPPVDTVEEEQQALPEPPTQPEYRKYTVAPGRLEFGASILCPRCHNKTRPIKENGDLRRDPNSKTRSFPCSRCNGFGLVPNAGPIPDQTPLSF